MIKRASELVPGEIILHYGRPATVEAIERRPRTGMYHVQHSRGAEYWEAHAQFLVLDDDALSVIEARQA